MPRDVRTMRRCRTCTDTFSGGIGRTERLVGARPAREFVSGQEKRRALLEDVLKRAARRIEAFGPTSSRSRILRSRMSIRRGLPHGRRADRLTHR